MSEFGIIAATGEKGMASLLAIIVDEARPELSAAQRAPLMATAAVLAEIEASIRRIDALVHAHAKSDPNANRLMTLRGVAEVVARAFAASLGLTPKFSGTGGSVILGAMSKRGNGYLRRLLYLGSASRLAQAIRRCSRGCRSRRPRSCSPTRWRASSWYFCSVAGSMRTTIGRA